MKKRAQRKKLVRHRAHEGHRIGVLADNFKGQHTARILRRKRDDPRGRNLAPKRDALNHENLRGPC